MEQEFQLIVRKIVVLCKKRNHYLNTNVSPMRHYATLLERLETYCSVLTYCLSGLKMTKFPASTKKQIISAARLVFNPKQKILLASTFLTCHIL